MLREIDRLTEMLATELGVSRRGFLVRLGLGLLAVAGALAGAFGVPAEARADYGSNQHGKICCLYACGYNQSCLHQTSHTCPDRTAEGCSFQGAVFCKSFAACQ